MPIAVPLKEVPFRIEPLKAEVPISSSKLFNQLYFFYLVTGQEMQSDPLLFSFKRCSTYFKSLCGLFALGSSFNNSKRPSAKAIKPVADYDCPMEVRVFASPFSLSASRLGVRDWAWGQSQSCRDEERPQTLCIQPMGLKPLYTPIVRLVALDTPSLGLVLASLIPQAKEIDLLICIQPTRFSYGAYLVAPALLTRDDMTPYA